VCLDGTAKVEKDRKVGWNCPTCGMFCKENETKEDTLLEKLIAMKEGKTNVQNEDQICEFCDVEKTDLCYCKDCRMVICSRCKYGHKKIPATKHHSIGNISKQEDVIDEVIYCSNHQSHIVETFCETCNEVLCKMCLENHIQHVLRTVEQTLSKLVVDMDECMKNITTKLETNNKQVTAIDEEILNLQETYAKWRIDSDTKLEMLINKLKATKALLDEQVNDEESRNLQTLREIKTKIENQGGRFKIVSTIASITKMKTQHLSHMKELQSGLLKQATELKRLEIHVENLQLTTPYIDEKLYDYTDDEMLQLLRPVKYVNTNKIIDQSGIKIAEHVKFKCDKLYAHNSSGIQIQENVNKCEDLKYYLSQKFNKVNSFLVSKRLSNRFSTLDDSLYVGIPESNRIFQYNTAGRHIKTFNNTQKTIVLKQASNGDIIVGGMEGLFVTNKELQNWLLIQGGSFSDVVIHGNKFTAIDYNQYKIVTYEWINSHGDKYQWTLKSSIDIRTQHRNNVNFYVNATLAINSIDNNVIVCCDNTLVVYSNSGKHVKNITLSGNSSIVGKDNKGNMILGEYWTGNIYSIKDVTQLDKNHMTQYLVGQKYQYIYDMTVDCDKNLWILHGHDTFFNLCYLTKYVPMN
jgi:predicted regulator of Ras-like GTPase activity (Roadblock/LC7/MglB family)